MITTGLLLLLYGVLRVILSPIFLLSNVAPNSSIVSAVVTANGYISSLNVIFPVTTILIILGLMFAFEVGYMAYKIIRWVYQKIPTIN